MLCSIRAGCWCVFDCGLLFFCRLMVVVCCLCLSFAVFVVWLLFVMWSALFGVVRCALLFDGCGVLLSVGDVVV